MANIPSAEKRNRQRLHRRQRNLNHLTRMRTCVKGVRAALDDNDTAQAQTLLKKAVVSIDRAAQKGVIKREAASRSISRLTRAVQKLAQPST